MFDFLPTQAFDEPLNLARCLFSDHGDHLAEAAARLGGACGEARAVSCAHKIETAIRMNHRIRRDLGALYRLLSLENVGDPECLETDLFAEMAPDDPLVDTICLLSDLLSDLLNHIDSALAFRTDKATEGGARS